MPQVVLMPPDMSSRTSLGERQKIVDAFMRFDTDSSGSLEHEGVLNILTRATGKQGIQYDCQSITPVQFTNQPGQGIRRRGGRERGRRQRSRRAPNVSRPLATPRNPSQPSQLSQLRH